MGRRGRKNADWQNSNALLAIVQGQQKPSRMHRNHSNNSRIITLLQYRFQSLENLVWTGKVFGRPGNDWAKPLWNYLIIVSTDVIRLAITVNRNWYIFFWDSWVVGRSTFKTTSVVTDNRKKVEMRNWEARMMTKCFSNKF